MNVCDVQIINSKAFNKMFYLAKIKMPQRNPTWRLKFRHIDTRIGASLAHEVFDKNFVEAYRKILRFGSIKRIYSCWGHYFEGIAVELFSYELEMRFYDGVSVKGDNGSSCTVDGFGKNDTGELVTLEIKCPVTRPINQQNKIPPRYRDQVAQQMYICHPTYAIYGEARFVLCPMALFLDGLGPYKIPKSTFCPAITMDRPEYAGFGYAPSTALHDVSSLSEAKVCDFLECPGTFKLVPFGDMLHFQDQVRAIKTGSVMCFFVLNHKTVVSKYGSLPNKLLYNNASMRVVHSVLGQLQRYKYDTFSNQNDLVIYLADFTLDVLNGRLELGDLDHGKIQACIG